MLVQYRKCAYDLEALWLSRKVANQKWNGVCVKSAKEACKDVKIFCLRVDKVRFN